DPRAKPARLDLGLDEGEGSRCRGDPVAAHAVALRLVSAIAEEGGRLPAHETLATLDDEPPGARRRLEIEGLRREEHVEGDGLALRDKAEILAKGIGRGVVALGSSLLAAGQAPRRFDGRPQEDLASARQEDGFRVEVALGGFGPVEMRAEAHPND